MSDHPHDHHHHRQGIFGWLRHTFAHTHATHERTDAALETSAQGIRALKISLVGLGLTALFQVVIVVISGSVALLADTIHNFADASTSIILWIAFVLGRRQATRHMTYGYGRAEDVAGILIVLIIFASAVVAGYESIRRVMSPELMEQPFWVAAAALIGFIGNEAVAVYRIRVGRQIGSAALVADGMHSRVDGFTSLAVLFSAVAALLGWSIADAIIGLCITIAILFIVKDVGAAVVRHIVDGIEPEIIDAAEHAIAHVEQVERLSSLRARWLGHKVYLEADVEASDGLTLREAAAISNAVEHALYGHLPALGQTRIRVVGRATVDHERSANDYSLPSPAGSQ
ncbi:MAG: cation diffusion facilitator family transporter [Spirochaetia bacterium]